jgi:hypothetical protein
MLNLEARARSSAAPPAAVGPGDDEVLTRLKARLEGAIRDEIAATQQERHSGARAPPREPGSYEHRPRKILVKQVFMVSEPAPGSSPETSRNDNLRFLIRECQRATNNHVGDGFGLRCAVARGGFSRDREIYPDGGLAIAEYREPAGSDRLSVASE